FCRCLVCVLLVSVLRSSPLCVCLGPRAALLYPVCVFGSPCCVPLPCVCVWVPVLRSSTLCLSLHTHGKATHTLLRCYIHRYTLMQAHTYSLSLSLSKTHTHTHTNTQTYIHRYTLMQAHTYSLSLSLNPPPS